MVVIVVALVQVGYESYRNHFTKKTEVLGLLVDSPRALDVLDTLEIKGRAPKNNYSRDQFGVGWQVDRSGCDTRNKVLARDLQNATVGSDGCSVLSGTLQDPYTAREIMFKRGPSTSDKVQIDHIVALSDAWQKGAQQFEPNKRVAFANDALNLLAVDGPTNEQKSNSDAASWLPTNKDFRCRYVARQIAVKRKYSIWVTKGEYDAMKRVLFSCSDQVLPVEVK